MNIDTINITKSTIDRMLPQSILPKKKKIHNVVRINTACHPFPKPQAVPQGSFPLSTGIPEQRQDYQKFQPVGPIYFLCQMSESGLEVFKVAQYFLKTQTDAHLILDYEANYNLWLPACGYDLPVYGK